MIVIPFAVYPAWEIVQGRLYTDGNPAHLLSVTGVRVTTGGSPQRLQLTELRGSSGAINVLLAAAARGGLVYVVGQACSLWFRLCAPPRWQDVRPEPYWTRVTYRMAYRASTQPPCYVYLDVSLPGCREVAP